MQLAAMAHSTSLADLPPEIVGQILAAAVHSMRMDYLNILASDARDHDNYWHNLLPYLQLRGVCSGYVPRTSSSRWNIARGDHAVDACQHRACCLSIHLRNASPCCRWRSLLGSLPLPVEHVDVRSAKNLCGLEAAPLRIGHLRVWVRPEDIETAIDALASVVASRRFQHHSGASLRLISAPAFTFPADSAAAFSQLTGIGRLNARSLPPQLPAGLEDLVLEGDGQQLTTLPSDIIGTCPQLRRLAMFNMAVDAEQLPRSLSALDLVK
jgi:hypothetical protein